MQNEEKFCTIIENLNTNGFDCRLAEADTTHCGETISTALVVVLRVLHFRFFDETNDDRKLVNRHIVQKQFELFENKMPGKLVCTKVRFFR